MKGTSGRQDGQADLDLPVVGRADQHAVPNMQHRVADLQADIARLAESIGEPLTTHRVGERHRPIADLGSFFVATLGRQRGESGL